MVAKEARKSSSIGSLPRPLGDMPGLEYKGKLLLFGGGSGEDVRDEILSIDPLTGACDEIGKMPYKSRGHQVVRMGNVIYLLGGFEAGTRNDCHALDIEHHKAERLAPLPFSNAWFSAVEHKGNIVVLGGFSIPSGYLPHAGVFDPTSGKWETVKDVFDDNIFPKPHMGSNVLASHGGHIYSFGGADTFDPAKGRANALDLAIRFFPDEKRWEKLAFSLSPREGIVAARHGEKLYLVGGMPEKGEKPFNDIEELNFSSMSLRLVGKLPYGCLTPAVACIKSRLIIAGGVTKPLFEMTDKIQCLNINS